MAWATAGQIVNQAATEAGIGPSADPFASVDPNFVQLCAALTSCGREMVLRREWSQLVVSYSFLTVANQTSYPLPADFRSYIDQSGWNRSTRLPMQAVSAQQYEYVIAMQIGITLNILFRLMDQTLTVTPTPVAVQTLAFEYRSSNWVSPTGGATPAAWTASTSYTLGQKVSNTGNIYQCTTAGVSGTGPGPIGVLSQIPDGAAAWAYLGPATVGPTTDAPTASSDVVYFDKLMMAKSVKLAFLADKGFDTTSAQQKFDDVYSLISGADTVNPVLRVDGGGSLGPVLIGWQNIPITSYGGA